MNSKETNDIIEAICDEAYKFTLKRFKNGILLCTIVEE